MKITFTCRQCGQTATKVRAPAQLARSGPPQFCSRAHADAWSQRDLPTVEWLRQKYEVERLDCVQIAGLVGRDPKRVWEWLRRSGVETRSRGGASTPGSFVPGQRSAFAGRTHTPHARERFRQQRLADGRVPYLVNGEHYAKSRRPDQHPNWQGGVTPEHQAFYASKEWRLVSRAVWVRDRCLCRRCGTRPPSSGPKHARGHVHHIAPFRHRELRAEMSNLILLCAPCHRWVHSSANTERELIA